MAEKTSPSRENTPTSIPAPRPIDPAIHAPAIPSPLNPTAPSKPPKPPPPPPREREVREKKESLKKREATGNTRGATPDVKIKKQKGPTVPSPMRYSIPEPKLSDYEPPKDPAFMSHEPAPLFSPDGRIELKRPIDHAENKRAYRYTHCIADPHFIHKQYYRSSDSKPYIPRMSVEDSDRLIHFDSQTVSTITNEKGWRSSRANVFAREGSLYYEVKILTGVPTEGPIVPSGQESLPQPHIRMGWARREAPLDAPVGFDGYSYGVTDIRFETMHKSRSGKIALPTKSKAKKSKAAAAAAVPVHENDHVRTGDVIGLLITLPSLSLHKKVIDGIYNPAVDVSPGFDDPITGAEDIIRDRIPVPYRGNMYFEQFEYQATKSIEAYSDRGPFNKIQPHPNHEDVVLRSLPHSSIKVFKNGKLIGTAFEKLLAFLPPSSVIPASTGARVGFDDGSLGYYPFVSSFSGGIAQMNFGPDFWCPPQEVFFPTPPTADPTAADGDIRMGGTVPGVGIAEPSHSTSGILDVSKPRGICERYREQIVEDIVWDIVDEADFFAKDGGYNYVPDKNDEGVVGGLGAKAAPTARGLGTRDE
ncbi:hypothetical protein EJ08DRAFT_617333 [Tothia fuscella]|uniref:SPRY domain-containing protein n=1 Tax=Tothia fuscella TaxID=1048955 RepID=A0A9P4NKW0_9PEZI|nr:hypothetical protein EJ08DRAFT_617333 [Tothia fuscella]